MQNMVIMWMGWPGHVHVLCIMYFVLWFQLILKDIDVSQSQHHGRPSELFPTSQHP